MLIKIFTLKFSEAAEGFDDEELRRFIADKQVISLRDRFFFKDNVPYWTVMITYKSVPEPSYRHPGKPRGSGESYRKLLTEACTPLDRNLRLHLKEKSCYIAPVTQGLPFLGFRIFPNLTRLKHANAVRFRRKFRYKEKLYLSGKLSEEEFVRSAASLVGHATHADTVQMRRKYFYDVK